MGKPKGWWEKKNPKRQVRWLIQRDLREVLKIERESFEYPWNEEDFLIRLRQRNTISMVCEDGDEVVGFMMYELSKKSLLIVNFAVKADVRRQDVGSVMIRRLIDKLSPQRRSELFFHVRETNLPGQLFLRIHGFKAINVVRNHYEHTDDDLYVMRYRLAVVKPSPFTGSDFVTAPKYDFATLRRLEWKPV